MNEKRVASNKKIRILNILSNLLYTSENHLEPIFSVFTNPFLSDPLLRGYIIFDRTNYIPNYKQRVFTPQSAGRYYIVAYPSLTGETSINFRVIPYNQ